MMENNRTIKKFAWVPTKVKILNTVESKTVIVWFSNYFEFQTFKLVKDFEWIWVWVPIMKYLHPLD